MNTAAIPDSSAFKGGTVLSGVLIIAGTCIGAGMLALPVVTGIAGFYPALFISTLCWLFMLCTGLLFLEATLWLEDGANVMTLSGHFLGTIGKFIGASSFLFLYYCLLVSYISAGSGTCRALLSDVQWELTPGLMITLFTAFFGLIVWLGPKMIDRVNGILMGGLIITFFMIIFIGADNVQRVLLERADWGFTWLAAPVLFSAYGYHNVIPSLSTYLRRDTSKLKWTIILGTLLPFIVYNVWQWLIIGSMSQEQLEAAANHGLPITDVMATLANSPWLSTIGAYFGLFAIVTSLLGVGLSMVDFLGDAFSVRRDGAMRFFLTLGAFLPPAFLAWLFPGIFLTAIGIAGGFGEAILNGLIPIMMVWIGRYRLGLYSTCRLAGGRLTLLALLGFTIAIIALEGFYLWG